MPVASKREPTDAIGEAEGAELQRMAEDESQRSELKSFLDQCQAEFTYLMITPANPIPPRESPPLPLLELREAEFGLPSGQQLDQYAQASRQQPTQNHVRDVKTRQAPVPANHLPPTNTTSQAAPSSNSFGVNASDAQAAPHGPVVQCRDGPVLR